MSAAIDPVPGAIIDQTGLALLLAQARDTGVRFDNLAGPNSEPR
ncbi:hypothetical protein [Raineyella fluvialis]|nr:hypothetical protein [Raineyella fluvialis]